jgi:hypothetical protein
MGRGMGGIVPIRVPIAAGEFSEELATAADLGRGLTRQRNSVGQPPPVPRGDVFRKARLTVMISLYCANLVEWIRKLARKTIGRGSQSIAPPFPSEVAAAIMDAWSLLTAGP